jgi:AcrR family transcriptional regulator
MTDLPVSTLPESEARNRVLDAARPLFVEYGYKGVSMQQIAAAAGLHKATLYHHFKDKDALFAAVVMLELQVTRAEMVRAIERESTPAKRLTAVAWTFFQASHADFGRLMGDVHTYLPQEMRQAIIREQALPWEEVEAMFREGVTPEGQPPLDTDMAAGLYAGVIWGQIWLRKVGRVTEPLSEDLAARLVDVLLAGLSTSPAARVVEPDPLLR